jgi:L-lactate dehydrogenase complex protein LldG
VTARDDVLARIRTALGSTAQSGGQPVSDGITPGAGFRTRSGLDTGELLDLLAERIADYQAAVRRTTRAGLGAAVGAALADRAARRVVVPAGLALSARPAGVEFLGDDETLSASDLDGLDGVITGAAVAIAETGTIILDGSAGQGRRAITLVPDYHLCIVQADQVVGTVPEAIERLAATADRPLTWISGPSATSDIELERVEGVHGPRTLEVILVSADS